MSKVPDWDRICHWDVGGKKFLNPISAWKEIKQSKSAFRFAMFDDVYGKYNWQVEPTESWAELSRQRAQQLRDKYKWLRLWYSGGRDSHHILNTFIDNNIHIDEVMIFHNQFDDIRDYEMKNIVYPLAAKLLMHTTTKINTVTLNKEDWNNRFSNYWADPADDEIWQGWWFQPNNPSALIKSRPDIFKLDSTTTVGNIMGPDKPRVLLENGNWYMHINDRMFEFAMSAGEIELFYMTPDLPAIHAKQCWMAINHLEKNYMHLPSEWLYKYVEGRQGPELYDEFSLIVGRGPCAHPQVGLGTNKTSGEGLDTRFKKILDHASQHNEFSWKNYNANLTELKQSVSDIFNSGDPLLGTVGILSNKHFIKPAVNKSTIVD